MFQFCLGIFLQFLPTVDQYQFWKVVLYSEQLQSFRVTEDAQNNHYAFFVKVNITLECVWW